MKYTGIPELKSNKPWFVMAAITALEDELLQPGWTAFEWGCGYSTVWLSQWCASAVSVEHNPEWVTQTQSELDKYGIENVWLLQADLGGPYEGFIQTYPAEKFDMIFIDGRNRAACLSNAPAHLKPGGILVLDNSERDEYQAAIEENLEGWERWDYVSEGGGYAGWTTTIWRKP